jgi:ribonuclease HI
VRVLVHVDGGARGNPGPAAAAAVLSDGDGRVLDEAAEVLGVATNNVAEYRALLLGLQRAQELRATEVDVVNDSELVARQVNGEYKVKHPDLQPLHRAAMEVLAGFQRWSIRSVPRAQNAHADALVNQALDARRTPATRPPLRSLAAYGGVLFDLDGTLYRGDIALPGASDFVEACRSAGLRVAFGTNNALLRRETIAARLRRMGIDADEEELVTAPDALAAVVRADGRTDVVRLGGAGLAESLDRAGLSGPDVMDADPAAVRPGHTALAVGLDPERSLAGVARAAALVEAGATVYASAAEPHYPTDRGVEAGTGTLLAALNAMAPIDPILCGKPSRRFGERAATALATERAVLVVGDSLPADVGVADAMGWDSLLLFTGAARDADLQPDGSPTHAASDLVAVLRDLRG